MRFVRGGSSQRAVSYARKERSGGVQGVLRVRGGRSVGRWLAVAAVVGDGQVEDVWQSTRALTQLPQSKRYGLTPCRSRLGTCSSTPPRPGRWTFQPHMTEPAWCPPATAALCFRVGTARERIDRETGSTWRPGPDPEARDPSGGCVAPKALSGRWTARLTRALTILKVLPIPAPSPPGHTVSAIPVLVPIRLPLVTTTPTETSLPPAGRCTATVSVSALCSLRPASGPMIADRCKCCWLPVCLCR
jgi:hypothetical protein